MKTIFEKPYVWSFLGQVKGKPTRENMLAELKQVRGEHFIHITEKWNDANQIDVQQYKQILSDSIFVPCPSGWGGDRGLKDCFRLYEALEADGIMQEPDANWLLEYINTEYGGELDKDSSWSDNKHELKIYSETTADSYDIYWCTYDERPMYHKMVISMKITQLGQNKLLKH